MKLWPLFTRSEASLYIRLGRSFFVCLIISLVIAFLATSVFGYGEIIFGVITSLALVLSLLIAWYRICDQEEMLDNTWLGDKASQVKIWIRSDILKTDDKGMKSWVRKRFPPAPD